MPSALDRLETPALLLDAPRMRTNARRMLERMATLGVQLRPHVKTPKCLEVVREMVGAERGPITVSTLREADEFADHGFTDICYAVGLAPNKIAHVRRLLDRGVRLDVLVDNVESAAALSAATTDWPQPVGVLLEIDTDGHRAGIPPDDPALLEVAAALRGPGVTLRGVLTHAGASYDCRGDDALRRIAEQERAGAVRAAERLRAAGHAAPVVSVGSTPTALFAQRLDGVTEVRAGVYVFFDLVMAGVGACSVDALALSVLTSVIGHQRRRGWTLVDAGWMALSRDRGTASQPVDQGYGLVCDADGRVLDDYIVASANQEHGVIAHRSGDPARMLDLPVGTLLRILPNHACATAAQHPRYEVLDGDAPLQRWARFSGW